MMSLSYNLQLCKLIGLFTNSLLPPLYTGQYLVHFGEFLFDALLGAFFGGLLGYNFKRCQGPRSKNVTFP
jgi:hypothetical protein